MQTFDEHGRPATNGPYQMIDGRLCMREGQGMAFSINFMDSAPHKAPSTLRHIPAAPNSSATTAKALRDHALVNRYNASPAAFSGVNLAIGVTRAAMDLAQARPLAPPAAISDTQRIRDAALAERYQPSAPAASEHVTDATSHHSLADTASIRNDARAARYA